MSGDDRSAGVRGGEEPPEGIEAFEGPEASLEALREARIAGGDHDAIEEGLARIRAGRPELAFDVPFMLAALAMRDSDGPGFMALRRDLKAASVPVGQWERDLRSLATRERERAREAEKRRAIAAAERRERAAAEALDGERRALAERASKAAPDLAAHHVEVNQDGITYRMSPGRVVMVTAGRKGAPEVSTLARFSAPIAAELRDLEAPDAQPRRVFQLSALVDGEAQPRLVDVPAWRFARMEWPEELLGARAAVSPGRGARDHLRAALQLLSSPAVRTRFRFTGWTLHEGRPVYVAGGVIGAAGAVSDVDVAAGSPADRFALPAPPEGEDRWRAACALVELLNVEPAGVMVPLVGLAFRSVMGPSRLTVHVSGRKGLGKSMLAGLVSSLFGASLFDNPLASWADGSTANGITRTLATVGDAPVLVDDLRVGGARDDAILTLFGRVVRAHFNRAEPRKLTREGGSRNDPPSRASILSTGEVLPYGHSTRDRAVCVDLDVRPAPDLETAAETAALVAAGDESGARQASSLEALHRKAREGELARAMAAFVQWYAPRYVAERERLNVSERDAAKRWGLGDSDRAAGLFGALVIGLEQLFAFLSDAAALDAEALAAHRQRALITLRATALSHGERVAEEDPASRFCECLRELLLEGAAHVKGLRPPPKGGTCTPPQPDAFGWRSEPRADGPQWTPRGPCIGYLSRRGGELSIIPGSSFTLVRERLQRQGHPLDTDKDGLGDALRATGALARLPPEGRRGDAVKLHVGGAEIRVWALRLDVLGIALPAEQDPPAESDASDGDADADV